MSFLSDTTFWWNAYYTVRAIVIVLDAALLSIFIYALVKGWEFRPKMNIYPKSQPHAPTLRGVMMQEKWRGIREKFAIGTPEALRVAVIEADAFIDEALTRSGLSGAHMADRLSQLRPEEVKTLDRVWRAHRLRNDLVHTPGFVVSAAEAETAMGDYEAFLKEMEIIE